MTAVITSERHPFEAALSYPTVLVGGFETIVCTRAELAQLMVDDCRAVDDTTLPKLVFSSNGQGISLAASDQKFAKAMAQADIVHADGMSVVLASKLLARRSLPERICTTDFFEDAVGAAIENDLKFYFLGGTEPQNARAVQCIRETYPALKIAGRRNGYFSPSEATAVCAEIRESGADVLWVALGKPLQEYWSVEHREKLHGIAWIKTCGGLYGYFAGDEKRAPLWLRRAGFEWAFRILQNPRRLLGRYLVTNPHAIWQFLTRTK